MKPARSTGSCQTPVRKRTPPSTMAPKPAKKTSELASASATARWRITAGSMIGLGCRLERTTSAAVARTNRAKAPRIEGLVQPQLDPSTMAAARLATAIERNTAPERSALWATGSLISRRTRMPTTSATRLKGRFTRKTQRQLACTRSPPIGRAEGRRRTAHGGPQADRRAFACRAEGGEEQTERGGQHQCAAAGLKDAGGHQEIERRRHGAQGRGHGEDAQPEQEGLLAAGPIGPPTGRHQQGGENDGVGAEHPRHRSQRLAVEALRDAREGDVHDEQVERRQEDAGEDHQRCQTLGRSVRTSFWVSPRNGLSAVMQWTLVAVSCIMQCIRPEKALSWRAC